MSWFRPRRATLDPSRPEPWGACDRCGFTYNLRDLRAQPQYAGAALTRTNTLVCEQCFDEPDEQARAFVIRPDGGPVPNPRPNLLANHMDDD